jgi:transcription-repair coupling factor (superfamily II helicase)
MTLYLISDPSSPYYQSSSFDNLLLFVQQHARQCQLRESGKKRSVIIRNIATVETAVVTLEEMLISQNQRDR